MFYRYNILIQVFFGFSTSNSSNYLTMFEKSSKRCYIAFVNESILTKYDVLHLKCSSADSIFPKFFGARYPAYYKHVLQFKYIIWWYAPGARFKIIIYSIFLL